jgi:hypothetical protein
VKRAALSRDQRPETREQRAERREQRAESREQRAESREQRAELSRAERRGQMAEGIVEQRAGRKCCGAKVIGQSSSVWGSGSVFTRWQQAGRP